MRKVWFITRPERDPKFHRDALIALWEATNGLEKRWSRNREVHLEYERVLYNHKIKRANISNDGSGGRTWVAMLKTFAYIYTDDEGYLHLTKVGQKVLEGIKVRENVTKQILTLQIPNAYFLEPGFRPKFEPDFKILPARFLIKVTNQAKLNYYITKEEITYFVLTAKNDNDLQAVVDNIIKFRNADKIEKNIIKDNIAKTFDHRKRLDSVARDYEEAHGDVAHTFMLICDYTGLVEYIRGESLRISPSDSNRVTKEIQNYDNRYPFNTRYLISLQRMAENNGLDIDSFKSSNYGNIKPATNRFKTEVKVRELLSIYPDLDTLSYDEVKSTLVKELSPSEAETYVYNLKNIELNTLNNDFVESYLNELNNLAFEDKTGEIFKAIGFEVEMRPKPVVSVDTEIEILLKYESNLMGIIDAKNYRKSKFALSAALASHMASEYIPNYNGYKGRYLTFFGYITADEWTGEKNLSKISELAKRVIPNLEIKGIMLSAKVLLSFLDYCIDNNLTKKERVKLS